MKKFIAILLVLMAALVVVACTNNETTTTTAPATTAAPTTTVAPAATTTTAPATTVKVMTYAEYDAAAIDSAVVIEAYVQATQSWWFDSEANHGKITVYSQDSDGAYFIYEMKCDEADAAKLTKGAKIRVSGVKAEWSGEVEIVDATFELLDGTWIAEAMDATALLGTDELIKHQNKFVSFSALTLEKVEYKNGTPGNDIYVTVAKDGKSYSFCVESYLTGPDTDVYKAFANLAAGDVLNIEGFLYWYEGVNTHITSVSKAN